MATATVATMTTGRDDAPDFVHRLFGGAEPSEEPLELDPETERQVTRQLKEIEEARAEAAVSGRDYLIR